MVTSIVLLFILCLSIIGLLAFQVSLLFNEEEKKSVRLMTTLQKRGYYLMFIGIVFSTIFIFAVLILGVMLFFDLDSFTLEESNFIFKTIGMFLLNVSILYLFMNIYFIGIIINGAIISLLLKYMKPSILIEKRMGTLLLVMFLSLVSLVFMRPLVPAFIFGILVVFMQVDSLETLDYFDGSPLYWVVSSFNFIGPILMIVGCIMILIENRKKSSVIEKEEELHKES